MSLSFIKKATNSIGANTTEYVEKALSKMSDVGIKLSPNKVRQGLEKTRDAHRTLKDIGSSKKILNEFSNNLDESTSTLFKKASNLSAEEQKAAKNLLEKEVMLGFNNKNHISDSMDENVFSNLLLGAEGDNYTQNFRQHVSEVLEGKDYADDMIKAFNSSEDDMIDYLSKNSNKMFEDFSSTRSGIYDKAFGDKNYANTVLGELEDTDIRKAMKYESIRNSSWKQGVKDRYTNKDGFVKPGTIAKDALIYGSALNAGKDVFNLATGNRSLTRDTDGSNDIPIVPFI